MLKLSRQLPHRISRTLRTLDVSDGYTTHRMTSFLPTPIPMGEPDIRLEDYLDDKLQSTADLENIDALLANVELQHSQLQAQLGDATKELEESRRASETRQSSLMSQIDDFNTLQQSIDARPADRCLLFRSRRSHPPP